jgi:hypothetical protein
VLFNTSGTPAQNIPLTQIAKFPVAGSAGVPSNHDIYAQIFFARNPNLSAKPDVTAGSFVINEAYVIKTLGSTSFTSIGRCQQYRQSSLRCHRCRFRDRHRGPLNPFASNASSYKGNGTGAIGATWTGSGNSASGTTLTVGTFAAYPAIIISIGDTIFSSGGSGNITGTPTIVSQLTSTEAGGALGGRGTYQLSASQTVTAVNGRNWFAYSSVLRVSACTICFFDAVMPFPA